MREFRQIIWGVLVALISAGIILGSMSVALIEGGMGAFVARTPTQVTRLVTQPVPSIFAPVSTSSTKTAVVMLLTPLSVTRTPSITTSTATPRCPQPQGWLIYTIQPGDTLDSIADAHNTTANVLAKENCLEISSLIPGTELYVPNVYPTAVIVQCGPFPGWVFYTVKPGDNLYQISLLFGTTVSKLQYANCLGNSTLIRAGQKLYVPNVATITPKPFPTDTEQPQPSLTATSPPSATAVNTLMPTQMLTATPTMTQIPVVSPTNTPMPSNTPTNVPTSTSTATNIPTIPPTPTPTPTATATNLPPTETPTSTPTPTLTPVLLSGTNTVTPTNP